MSQSSIVDLSHLQPVQQEDIQALLDPELFQEKPGFTTLVQHKVLKLKQEIELILELGIIETSTSEWRSSIVLVPKKDGSTNVLHWLQVPK